MRESKNGVKDAETKHTRKQYWDKARHMRMESGMMLRLCSDVMLRQSKAHKRASLAYVAVTASDKKQEWHVTNFDGHRQEPTY